MSFLSISQYCNSLKSSVFSKFLYVFIKKRNKKIALNNLELVFHAQLNSKEKKDFVCAMIDHFTKLVWEIFLYRFKPRKLITNTDILGKEHIMDALSHDKGVIILTGHLGNWEIMSIPLVGYCSSIGKSVSCVRKSIKNKLAEKLLFRYASKAGSDIISGQGKYRKILAALKQKNIVVYPFDQHVSILKPNGIKSTFFKRDVGSDNSLARLVHFQKIPVIPMAMFRKPDGNHTIEFYPAVSWQESATKAESLYINTLRYNQILERMIMRFPEQWIWFYKRWRLK